MIAIITLNLMVYVHRITMTIKVGCFNHLFLLYTHICFDFKVQIPKSKKTGRILKFFHYIECGLSIHNWNLSFQINIIKLVLRLYNYEIWLKSYFVS